MFSPREHSIGKHNALSPLDLDMSIVRVNTLLCSCLMFLQPYDDCCVDSQCYMMQMRAFV